MRRQLPGQGTLDLWDAGTAPVRRLPANVCPACGDRGPDAAWIEIHHLPIIDGRCGEQRYLANRVRTFVRFMHPGNTENLTHAIHAAATAGIDIDDLFANWDEDPWPAFPEREHTEIERFELNHFPPDSPHRVRVRCTCGHTPSILRWNQHIAATRPA